MYIMVIKLILGTWMNKFYLLLLSSLCACVFRRARIREKWNLLQGNFPYIWSPLLVFNSEHPVINGFKCLFTEDGFSRICIKFGFPPISLVSSCNSQPVQSNECSVPSKIIYPCFNPLQVKGPKVFVHGNLENKDVVNQNWPGCP